MAWDSYPAVLFPSARVAEAILVLLQQGDARDEWPCPLWRT
jgi:hypothetical protein